MSGTEVKDRIGENSCPRCAANLQAIHDLNLSYTHEMNLKDNQIQKLKEDLREMNDKYEGTLQ